MSHELLHHLWTAGPPVPIDGLETWWSRHRAMGEAWPHAFDHAVVAGAAADRVGYAFASGYQAAGRVAFGDSGAPLAFCATEDGGNHPRAIATRLDADGDGWRLRGRKSFVTLGSFATRWLVVANLGVEDGRNRLAVVDVGPRKGTTLEPLPPAPFVPEVPHAAVSFDDVRVESHERLEGDGYTAYLKPFRTLEDIHVHGALLGYLTAEARRLDDGAVAERAGAVLLGLRTLATAPPLAPVTHLALAGALTETSALVESTEAMWARADEGPRSRWERDRALLRVAAKARARRREVAWSMLR